MEFPVVATSHHGPLVEIQPCVHFPTMEARDLQVNDVRTFFRSVR